MRAYIGTSGWMYKHWAMRFFPSDLPKTELLKYFSQRFRTVEVNTTFYHMARKTTFEKWKQEVPANFVFALKLYRLFTHLKKLKLDSKDSEILKNFVQNGMLLKSKLGPILIQLPPSLKKDLVNLEKLITQMQKFGKNKLKLAVEFRHQSWFDDEVYDFMKDHNAAFVITNSPNWPSKVIKTADFVYMRFHGRTKLFASNYTPPELRQWHKKLLALKPKEVFAYFNNDANAYAADNALYLKKLFDEK